MRKTVVLIAGIAMGVYVGRQIETNPAAKRSLDEAGEKIKSFANAVSDGYREQEAASVKISKAKPKR